MAKMIAEKPVRYGRGRYNPGDVIPAVRDKDARVLEFLKQARRFEEPVAPVKYESAIKAEDAEEISERTGKPKRRYKRRDVQAED